MFRNSKKAKVLVDDYTIGPFIGALTIRSPRKKIEKQDWIFPAFEEDEKEAQEGCVGTLCVSKSQKILVPSSKKWLCAHVTFDMPTIFISAPSSAVPLVKVYIQNLHMTARPLESQGLIVEHGNSILQCKLALHRGVSNNWSITESKLEAIAEALELELNSLQEASLVIEEALSPYDDDYMLALQTNLMHAIVGKIQDKLPLLGMGSAKIEVYMNGTLMQSELFVDDEEYLLDVNSLCRLATTSIAG
ncbi:hypothetical protein BH10PSE19_BH10PSE19_18150 [soil metagenome]